VKKAEAILNEIENGGNEMTQEQERQFNHYTSEIKRINDDVDDELSNIRTS